MAKNETALVEQAGQLANKDAELATAGASATALAEIQGAMYLARQFPRTEAEAWMAVMKSCKRLHFAEDSRYEFPRGNSIVRGPSVHMAREIARCWGNVRYGINVIRDDDETRQIRGWAWDVETNTYTQMEDDFRKEVQRKQKDGTTKWVKVDERDLRELTNRRGAICVRNCLLQLFPSDLVEDAMKQCTETLGGNVIDPKEEAKRVIEAFDQIGVTVGMLEGHLDHAIGEVTTQELVLLRGIYTSIRDGNSERDEYFQLTRLKPEGAGTIAGAKERMKGKQKPPAPDPAQVEADAEMLRQKAAEARERIAAEEEAAGEDGPPQKGPDEEEGGLDQTLQNEIMGMLLCIPAEERLSFIRTAAGDPEIEPTASCLGTFKGAILVKLHGMVVVAHEARQSAQAEPPGHPDSGQPLAESDSEEPVVYDEPQEPESKPAPKKGKRPIGQVAAAQHHTRANILSLMDKAGLTQDSKDALLQQALVEVKEKDPLAIADMDYLETFGLSLLREIEAAVKTEIAAMDEDASEQRI